MVPSLLVVLLLVEVILEVAWVDLEEGCRVRIRRVPGAGSSFPFRRHPQTRVRRVSPFPRLALAERMETLMDMDSLRCLLRFYLRIYPSRVRFPLFTHSLSRCDSC